MKDIEEFLTKLPPEVKQAYVKLPLDSAMAVLAEESLKITNKLAAPHESERQPRISHQWDVPMCWVRVPYLAGQESKVQAILARIAPEAAPLGLCSPEAQTAASTESVPSSPNIPCPHEAGSSHASASHSGSSVDSLSAAGCVESNVEVMIPCSEANAPAADTQPSTEGAGREAVEAA
jgi:hypothetical protein